MPSRPYHTYLINSLKDPREAAAYLATVPEDVSRRTTLQRGTAGVQEPA